VSDDAKKVLGFDPRSGGAAKRGRKFPGAGKSRIVWVSECGKFKLNAKQKLFCDLYVAHGQSEGHKCYLEAGFKPASQYTLTSGVTQLLKLPQVKFYLGLRQAETEREVTVTRNYVIERLKQIADDSRNDAARVAALKQLGQHLNMWVDRTELTGRDGGPVAFSDSGADLSGVSEENLLRVKELLSARKPPEVN
jgi:hypothetical protein